MTQGWSLWFLLQTKISFRSVHLENTSKMGLFRKSRGAAVQNKQALGSRGQVWRAKETVGLCRGKGASGRATLDQSPWEETRSGGFSFAESWQLRFGCGRCWTRRSFLLLGWWSGPLPVGEGKAHAFPWVCRGLQLVVPWASSSSGLLTTFLKFLIILKNAYGSRVDILRHISVSPQPSDCAHPGECGYRRHSSVQLNYGVTDAISCALLFIVPLNPLDLFCPSLTSFSFGNPQFLFYLWVCFCFCFVF